MSVTVLYFASLRDAAGISSEEVPTPSSLPGLYAQLRQRHGFSLKQEDLRVAVDGAFSPWDAQLGTCREIAFIPPVSGG